MRTQHAIAFAALFALGACARDSGVIEARKLLREGRTESGLAMLQQAARDNPRDAEARAVWMRERETAIAGLIAQADNTRTQGRLADAEKLYGRAAAINPIDERPKAGLDAIAVARRHQQQVRRAEAQFDASALEAAEAMVRGVLAEDPANAPARALLRRILDARASRGVEPPVLKAGTEKTIDLEFRDAPLRSVFEVIARTTGINFIFDKDVRSDLRTSLTVRNSTVDDVIRLILVANQLGRKVLNDNTILIYPNRPNKLREHQELVMRTFYLANADIRQTLAMIKTMLKTRDVFIDEKLGLLVMKDTPEAIRIAEKLIAAQDLAEPEVTLEVEVLEVAARRIQELGLRAPEQIVFTDPATVPASGVPAAGMLSRLSGGLTAFVAVPPIIANLRQQDGITNVLANPRIRVKNREKARVHIGDRVPVITTTATANVGVSASVSYLDVGLKLEVQPTVQLEGQVIMKVGLEVSNITREVPVTGGGLAYQVGTRNAATALRLKDGETQVLAGLIQDDDRSTLNRIPGLADLPVLGRLFTNNNQTKSKTEIVLLITPHIVRPMVRPDYIAPEYYTGTDSAVATQPLLIRPTAAGALGISPSAPREGPRSAASVENAPAPAPPPAASPETSAAPAAKPANEPFPASQPQPIVREPR